MNPQSPSRLSRWAPLSAFSAGVVAISLWMFTIRHALPRSGRALERAKELGLVSWTTIHDYDIAQESTAWLLGCLLVPLGIWIGWGMLRSAKGEPRRPADVVFGAEELDDPEEEFAAIEAATRPRTHHPLWPPPPWAPWLGVAVVMLSVLFRSGVVHGPSPWGSFGLLGEEGVYLGAVQAMRTGRTLYTELAFPYGPLLIQPFDLWLRVAGDTVVAARQWVLLLQALGVGAVALTVSSFVGPRRGPWAGLGAALALLAIAPPFLPVLNSVALRPALALLPAALFHAAARGQAPLRHPLRWASAALAVAGLFSFEIAGVAVLSSAATLALHRVERGVWVRAALWTAGFGALGLLPLTLQGGLGGFFTQALEMVRLPSLGYQALPYPDVARVFRDAAGALGAYPPEGQATAVWAALPPLLIWSSLGAGLCALGRRHEHATTGLFLAALASAVLFRGALGRSDLYHLWFYGAVPVVVLSFVGLGLLWGRAGAELRAGLIPATLLATVALAAQDTLPQIAFPPAEELRLGRARGLEAPLTPRPVDVGRTGALRLLPRLGGQVKAITERAMRLPADEGVWFYPSEAAYYYLADREVPLRYLWAYDAATPAMQRAAIDDLQDSRPRWVFRSSDTFAIDHIPQESLVPLLDAWLATHYRPVQVLSGATLFEAVEVSR